MIEGEDMAEVSFITPRQPLFKKVPRGKISLNLTMENSKECSNLSGGERLAQGTFITPRQSLFRTVKRGNMFLNYTKENSKEDSNVSGENTLVEGSFSTLKQSLKRKSQGVINLTLEKSPVISDEASTEESLNIPQKQLFRKSRQNNHSMNLKTVETSAQESDVSGKDSVTGMSSSFLLARHSLKNTSQRNRNVSDLSKEISGGPSLHREVIERRPTELVPRRREKMRGESLNVNFENSAECSFGDKMDNISSVTQRRPPLKRRHMEDQSLKLSLDDSMQNPIISHDLNISPRTKEIFHGKNVVRRKQSVDKSMLLSLEESGSSREISFHHTPVKLKNKNVVKRVKKGGRTLDLSLDSSKENSLVGDKSSNKSMKTSSKRLPLSSLVANIETLDVSKSIPERKKIFMHTGNHDKELSISMLTSSSPLFNSRSSKSHDHSRGMSNEKTKSVLRRNQSTRGISSLSYAESSISSNAFSMSSVENQLQGPKGVLVKNKSLPNLSMGSLTGDMDPTDTPMLRLRRVSVKKQGRSLKVLGEDFRRMSNDNLNSSEENMGNDGNNLSKEGSNYAFLSDESKHTPLNSSRRKCPINRKLKDRALNLSNNKSLEGICSRDASHEQEKLKEHSGCKTLFGKRPQIGELQLTVSGLPVGEEIRLPSIICRETDRVRGDISNDCDVHPQDESSVSYCGKIFPDADYTLQFKTLSPLSNLQSTKITNDSRIWHERANNVSLRSASSNKSNRCTESVGIEKPRIESNKSLPASIMGQNVNEKDSTSNTFQSLSNTSVAPSENKSNKLITPYRRRSSNRFNISNVLKVGSAEESQSLGRKRMIKLKNKFILCRRKGHDDVLGSFSLAESEGSKTSLLPSEKSSLEEEKSKEEYHSEEEKSNDESQAEEESKSTADASQDENILQEIRTEECNGLEKGRESGEETFEDINERETDLRSEISCSRTELSVSAGVPESYHKDESLELNNETIIDVCGHSPTDSIDEDFEKFKEELRNIDAMVKAKCQAQLKVRDELLSRIHSRKPRKKSSLNQGKIKRKPIKLYKPAPWANKRLYDFLTAKLRPEFGLDSVNKAQKIVKLIFNAYKIVTKSKNYEKQTVDSLKLELAKEKIIVTTIDFYQLVRQFLPFDFEKNVIPCVQPFTNIVWPPKDSNLKVWEPILK